MKFDYAIGNPPYQETQDDTSDKPVYNYFLDEAFKVAEKVEMIHPARFLFNAGKTPKAWNEKMLNDSHFKVEFYEQNSDAVFKGTDIKGGVAITYRDNSKECGAIGAFTSFEELNSIKRKVTSKAVCTSLDDNIYVQNKFDLDALYKDYPQFRTIIGSGGRERRLTTPIFKQLSVFADEQTANSFIDSLR